MLQQGVVAGDLFLCFCDGGYFVGSSFKFVLLSCEKMSIYCNSFARENGIEGFTIFFVC